jgi:hypothetical protein
MRRGLLIRLVVAAVVMSAGLALAAGPAVAAGPTLTSFLLAAAGRPDPAILSANFPTGSGIGPQKTVRRVRKTTDHQP